MPIESPEGVLPIAVLIIGVIIVVVAFNNAHADLATALENDLPGYFKWAAALAAIAALGFVPGLKTPSRYLLALVLLVIFLTNYQTVLSGFTGFASSGGQASGAGAPDPTAAYVASAGTSTTAPSASAIAGSSTGASPANPGGGQTPAIPGSQSPGTGGGATPSFLNPSSYVSALSSIGQSVGFGGFA